MNHKSCVLGLLLSVAAASVFGQTNILTMPTIGQRLPVAKFELVNRIPSSRLKQLPKSLPVYCYSSKPSAFPAAGLQMLLDQSVFAGTNAADLLKQHTNTALLAEPLRLATARGLDFFLIAPLKGTIVVQNQDGGTSPSPDAVPSFEAVREQLLGYARAFGISTNDMERSGGEIHPQRTEDKITRMGGAVRFIARRSVAFSRSIGGHTMLANDDKIELALGVNGRLLRFGLKWPQMEAIRTNRLFTASRMLDEIKRGNFLADASNEYPVDGVSQIILKDMHIDYYAFSPRGFGPVSTNVEIFPVASLYAVFKSKSGKTVEGGLYAPILDSK